MFLVKTVQRRKMNKMGILGQADVDLNINSMGPWHKYLIFLSISFVICKVGLITRIILQGISIMYVKHNTWLSNNVCSYQFLSCWRHKIIMGVSGTVFWRATYVRLNPRIKMHWKLVLTHIVVAGSQILLYLINFPLSHSDHFGILLKELKMVFG